ncbi:Hypothetical predicted protein [Lecanosticta acicola]|uniref:Velvet domain-containing protein n=1 Tax=Lecanosticta acicola TaxID=111012 RepID=A0AAI9EFT7_9PEZI|nr:Hypothetical predicted protein [Lecanosticta acicola]
MSDSTQKSYLRDGCGPRAVDAGHGREKGRGESRRQREGDDSGKQRSKHTSSRRPSKSDSSHRRRESSGSYATSNIPERPSFELDVIGQPQRSIVFGATVETSVMVSLKCPSPDAVAQYSNMDTSRLMAVVSLVADTRSGERMQLENGTLTGQKMFDSVHPIPESVADSLARSQACRLALGYVSFPSLLIRQPGTYRLRVTLIKMGSSSSSSGGASVACTDSESIKVERRASGSSNPRKHREGERDDE